MVERLPAGLKQHKPDVFSLVMGLLFAGIGGLFLVTDLGSWALDLRWTGPVVLITIGVIGLLASIRPRGRADTD
ncbi:MAG: hypothetical protein JWN35_1055 [Frankiales bacterium]|jgi:hypothetical protein|nr:hypothetical protein [Frankiales bacterium]